MDSRASTKRSAWFWSVLVTIVLALTSAAWLVATAVTKSQIETLQSRITYLEGENHRLSTAMSQKQVTPASAPAKQVGATPESLNVEFKRPRNGDSLESPIEIEFSTIGNIPDGYLPVVVVKDPRGRYWSFGPAGNGRMSGVTLGVEGEQHDDFEIGVLITDQVVKGNVPFTILPRHLFYKKIKVSRK